MPATAATALGMHCRVKHTRSQLQLREFWRTQGWCSRLRPDEGSVGGTAYGCCGLRWCCVREPGRGGTQLRWDRRRQPVDAMPRVRERTMCVSQGARSTGKGPTSAPIDGRLCHHGRSAMVAFERCLITLLPSWADPPTGRRVGRPARSLAVPHVPSSSVKVAAPSDRWRSSTPWPRTPACPATTAWSLGFEPARR